jgi:hypothetical protein
MSIRIYLGTTLKTVSANIGAIHLPGPGTPNQLPANPLSSQLEQAHLAVDIKNVKAHNLPGHPWTLRPVSLLKETSSPHPTPERMKKPLSGPMDGTGFIDSSPREWYTAERMKIRAVTIVVLRARPNGYSIQLAISRN